MSQRVNKKRSNSFIEDSDEELNEKKPNQKTLKSTDDKEDNDVKNNDNVTPVEINDQSEKYFEIGNNRRLTVRAFKGKPLIDIREHYEKDGKTLPGKKGISLKPNEVRSFQHN